MPLPTTRAEAGGTSHQRPSCNREQVVTRCHGATLSPIARRSAAKGGTCIDDTIGSRRARDRRGGKRCSVLLCTTSNAPAATSRQAAANVASSRSLSVSVP